MRSKITEYTRVLPRPGKSTLIDEGKKQIYPALFGNFGPGFTLHLIIVVLHRK